MPNPTDPGLLTVSFLAAFLCGSLPTAFLAGKLKHVDIRRHGSGNVGATNAFRVLGKGYGIAVFLVDFLKGFLPAFLFPKVFWGEASVPALILWAGSAAILGHIFTPFLKFKGGKGVATGAGVVAALHPLLLLLMLFVWGAALLSTKIVSISSLISITFGVIGVLILKRPALELGFFFALFLLSLWTHRSNISRLFNKSENKVS